MSIKPVAVTAIFGMPIKKFSQKKPDRQIIWNDGTIPCDNQTLDMYERLYLSQKMISVYPCYTAVCYSLQPITCYLTTTKFLLDIHADNFLSTCQPHESRLSKFPTNLQYSLLKNLWHFFNTNFK